MKIEIRSASEAVIEGYVNAVERDSRVLPSARGKFVEQVRAKTFEKAIEKSKNIEVRFNHNKVLGSTNENNLELREDNIGLYAKATITDFDVVEKAKNKELRGWSFGFTVEKDEWEETAKGIPRRFLEDIELREVSILDKIPAYVGTSIEMRGEDALVYELRSLEDGVEIVDNSPPEPQEPPNYTNEEKAIEILKLRHL